MGDTKNYLIIGGNSGVGQSLTEILLAENHTLTLASRKALSDGRAKSILYDATQDELNLCSVLIGPILPKY